MLKSILPLLIVLVFSACRQSGAPFHTGLIVFKEFDSSRRFDTTGAGYAHNSNRPVKIDVFYPSAEIPAKPGMPYGDILDMYEQRMNYQITADSCRKTSVSLAGAFAEYLHLDSPSRILNYRTSIFPGLKLPAEKFPLIIYAAGMNGSSWENAVLFDSLARHGYVVAAVSSVGKFPGFMSEAVDLGEQVQDILFACKKMKAQSFIDTAKIGLLSWSLGGTAIVKAAMLSSDFRCLLSFDGTEIHYYGFDTAWDKEYNTIMSIPPFSPGNISIPYMYLSSEHPKKVDSIYVFPKHVHSADVYFLKLNHAIHEDFSSLPTIVKSVEPRLGNTDSSRHQTICRLALGFFDQYLKKSDTVSVQQMIRQLVDSRPGDFSTGYPGK